MHYLTEGSRIFFSSWKRRIFPRKYEGNATEICQQIIKDCWNGQFFQTSTGNFPQFWTRDFGWCTQALLKLGYGEEVKKTLRYALNRFQTARQVTTTITPEGKPFNFPNEAIDSLPWLIHSIRLSKISYHHYRHFLNDQIQIYKGFLEAGLVTPKKNFSSMKDFSLRKSSTYDNCMVAMLTSDLQHLKLDPLHSDPEEIKKHLWNDNYFYDDLSQQPIVAGDANLFPFLTGVADVEMFQKCLHKIQEAGLDHPFPLKYTKDRNSKFIWQEIFLRNYESDAIWTHMGPLFIKAVKQIDPELAKKYTASYTHLIEEHGNYLEVFNSKGRPFSTPFYYCDSGMLWAANYLTL